MIFGITVVFVRRRTDTKPWFVKAIWVLLCLAQLVGIVYWILIIKINISDKDGVGKIYTDLWP